MSVKDLIFHLQLYGITAELSGLQDAHRVKEIYAKIYENLPEIQRIHGGDFFASVDIITKRTTREELAIVLRHMGELHNELFELLNDWNVMK